MGFPLRGASNRPPIGLIKLPATLVVCHFLPVIKPSQGGSSDGQISQDV